MCACVTEIRTRRPADDDAQQQSYNILSSASSLSLSPSPSRSRSAPESQSNYSTVRAINTLHINSDADAHKHWQTNQRPSPTNCLSKKERAPARVTEREKETGRECSACEKREQVFNFVIGVQLIADNDTLHCR